MQGIKADEEVYGVMILIGTIIGAIAGIPQVDGYTGKLPLAPLDHCGQHETSS